jgi:hypothetical protein
MTRVIGSPYDVTIPTLADDADIETALDVYHTGLGLADPTKSITGYLASLNATIGALGATYIAKSPASLAANTVNPSGDYIPLTIKRVGGSNVLQSWDNGAQVGAVYPDGKASLNYIRIDGGSVSQPTTTALSVKIGNAAHKGAVITAASGQTANLQEWTNPDIMGGGSWVDSDGVMYSAGQEVVDVFNTQTLTNKTLDGPAISGATSITISGAQDSASRVRNITLSTAAPASDAVGVNGDVWIIYV